MESSHLVGLGKVAGIDGIALGVAMLLLRPVIEQSATLPEPVRGWLLIAIATGAFVIGLLGMVLWTIGRGSSRQVARTDGDESGAWNIDRTKGGGDQHARTKGKCAPAVNQRGR